MRILAVLILLISSSLAAGQAVTPGQNPCDETPVSQRQMNDCAAFEYRQSDSRLNKVYWKLMQYRNDDLVQAKKSPDQRQVEYALDGIQRLKEAERVWISYRDIQCKAAAQEYEGGSMAPMIYSQCLKTLTDQRIEAVKIIYEDGDRKLE